MAEIYKQIKDFTLKNSIDGTEDISFTLNEIKPSGKHPTALFGLSDRT